MNYRKPRLALLPLVMLGVLGLPGVRTFAQTYAYNAASLATGHNPQAILSADLNGDGRLDLVAANFNDNTISVLIGNPDGSYQPKVDYAVGNNPIGITVDDFDGNGKMDLAVVDNNCPTTPCTAVGSVSVLLGNGDGTFQPHVDKTVGNGPYGVVAHDFDADGKVDLIVTNSQDNNFTLLVGKGDGTFAFKRKLTTGISPHGIVKGDFNRDHKEDVLICDTGESNLTFFRGNGNGTFQNSIKFDTGPNPLNLVTGDVNADGRADVLVANSGNSTVSVLTAILRGHAFATHVDLAIPGIAAAVAIADMNGDGFGDVIATTEAIDGVSIMQSVGDGATFRPRVDFAAGVHPVSVSAGDFNGDGKVDVATLNNLDNSVIILPGKGNGGLQSLMGMPAGALPVAIAAADFNHDGFTDIAVASRSDNVVRILQGNGDGTFTMSPNTIPTGVKPSAMIAVDLTADGFSDLVVTNSADNTISVAVNNQVGGFQAPLTFAVGTKPSAVAAGQFNGDDRFDLVVANQASLNVSLLIGNGDGSFQPPHNFVTGLGTSPTGIAVGDFIGNGKLDVAVASGTGTVAVLLGQGDGTLTLPTQYPTAAGPNGIVSADFNGDGKLDLAVSTSSGVVSVLQGVGNGTFQTPVDFPVAATPLAVAVGDINGDGKQDLATGSSSLTINRIGVLLGNGDGTFQAPTYHATKLNASGATEAIALADFNNDGSLDVAAADHIANSLAVYLNSPLPALFPGSLDFGAELIGQPGPSQTVTLYNSGSALLNNLDITTDDPSEYSQVNGCGTSLAVGANCTIEVTFTPFNGGARNANIVLSDNGLGGPQTVGLTGIGSGPGAVLSVTSLTFPTTVIGTTSSRQTVILTNTGTETLNISSKVVTPVDFKLIPIGCGSTLSAGNSCGLGIAFAPTASGIITGSLTITDDAFGSPQVVSLTGTGTVVKLTPTALSFGPQAVGTSSSPQTVTLDNVGSATLNFTDTLITITGNNPLDFSQTNTCGTSVAGHGSCTITVTFTPTASGERDATVSISDDGGGSPQELPLSGNGT